MMKLKTKITHTCMGEYDTLHVDRPAREDQDVYVEPGEGGEIVHRIDTWPELHKRVKNTIKAMQYLIEIGESQATNDLAHRVINLHEAALAKAERSP